ncbi:MAG TPA: UDP-N-acetylglucosamine 1-carboxyvinyltransferase [Rhodospirillaceae bacterium]|nr:UDP-N-acetylglucosamine 1-carboxyvinyltransferase [Alphaproteobacteria bacterium]HBH26156.1 UDP-N-acetylglucosamine 1-carboxyvinyltransferase [Rhodospirillaceae bacterium]
MDRLRIVGGQRLNGAVRVSGAKNAALKHMCAALLADGALRLTNVPTGLRDIASQTALLAHLGVRVDAQGADMTLRVNRLTSHTAPYDLVRKMRGSILVLGPLLARFGRARVSLPGGCAIGTRPVDLHLQALRALGANVLLENGYITATAPQKGLVGAKVVFPSASVGATENLLMAATLAKGETVIAGAAREPEIADLAACLAAMGAVIEGAGTSTIRVQGVPSLHGAMHRVMPDRIEAGTWMIAAAMAGGRVVLKDADTQHLAALTGLLAAAGVTPTPATGGDLVVEATGDRPQGVDIMTAPYPGFPTDLQAQFMALLARADGAALVTETIFENRFMHAPELVRMGADIRVQGNAAIVRGVPGLRGAPVMATDLRASVALVLAGLVARGTTEVHRIYHLERGYENIVEKLRALGAEVERVPGQFA